MIAVNAWGSSGCLEEERIALLQVKVHMKYYAPGKSLTSWVNDTKSDCCKWYKVTCNNTTKRVTNLELSWIVDRSGGGWYINASVFLPFKQLNALDLIGNQLAGVVENGGFDKLSKLHNLEMIDLSYNQLNRSILSSLSHLSSLKNLSLDSNPLNSPANSSAFQAVKSLELQGNNITTIDEIHALKNLSNLEDLFLGSYFLPNTFLHKDFLQSIGPMNSLKVLSVRSVQFGGTLPSKGGWCELRNLKELRLSDIQLEGMLPLCLRNLTSLRLIDLSQNMLIGNIASSPLSTLTSIEYLSISHNSIEVPSSFRSFANHSKLRFILADENYAISETDEFQSVDPKFQLEVFSMSNCINLLMLPKFLHYQHDLKVLKISKIILEAEFPNWLLHNNTKLQEISMNSNNFTGALKFALHLPNPDLQILDFSNNKLSGEIPYNISSAFPNIVALNLSYNLFTGQIPSSLGNMKFLRFLDLSNNSFTGEIPKELLIGCTSLMVLQLSNNNLEGEIVQEFAYLTLLWLLHLDGNNFTGTISESLSNIPLVSLDMSGNKFSGKIPRWLGYIESLQQLTLSKNHLQGYIPAELCYLPELSFLDLSENNLTGSIPSCLNPYSIIYVGLSKNHLGGQLTSAFMNSTTLAMLDLSHNDFVGRIPEWIGSISKLSILLLKGNKFEGKIPIQVCQLMRLRVLDLSNNQLNGSIPSCLGKISLEVTDERSMVFNNLEFPLYTGPTTTYIISSGSTSEFEIDLPENVAHPVVEFTTKGNSYEYEGSILKYMSGIDLSANRLSGEIPYELENLTEIRALNFSRNNLSGTIPKAFSKLHNIESLDLSHNRLGGKIPDTLLNLNTLEVFNVAYNNLSGAIPEPKAQFATFSEDSYVGNPYLCGPPLHTSCNSAKSPSSPLPYDLEGENEESNGVDLEVFYISFGVSYAVFLLGIVLVLYINPYWRNTWFQLIEYLVYFAYKMEKILLQAEIEASKKREKNLEEEVAKFKEIAQAALDKQAAEIKQIFAHLAS
nr:LRR receptor-like serine/threonine-protein kinase ERL1 [Ipomoea batatas]